MTPTDVLARALAAALLDGPWEATPMLERLRVAFGTDRPSMRTLTRAIRTRFATPPSRDLHELAGWIYSMRSFGDFARERLPILGYALPPPEMTESPWRVPPLARRVSSPPT